MTGEGDEEDDVVDERIVTKCIVSRSEPANVGEGGEEDTVED